MTVHIRIYGQVQGVFFRFSAKEEADRWGLAGWVRNNVDGSVEAMVVGPKVKLAEFIKWCKKGPPSAGVENIEVDWRPEDMDFESFEILR